MDSYEGDTSLFTIEAEPAPGISLKQVEAGINRVIADLARSGVTANEMAEAHAQLKTSHLKSMQSMTAIAASMAINEAFEHDPDDSTVDLRKVEAVPAAAVRDVARKYFGVQRSIVLSVVPKTGAKP
jgi:predicted Zn-dependent peptidase